MWRWKMVPPYLDGNYAFGEKEKEVLMVLFIILVVDLT